MDATHCWGTTANGAGDGNFSNPTGSVTDTFQKGLRCAVLFLTDTASSCIIQHRADKAAKVRHTNGDFPHTKTLTRETVELCSLLKLTLYKPGKND